MSRANANNKNNPANRGVGGHIKEGLKNVPKVYNALYNAKDARGAKLGVANTVGANVRTVVTGKSSAALPAKPGAQRAKIAAVGASSVTPLGPIVAVGMGIAKSVADKKAAIAKQNPTAPKGPAKVATKPAASTAKAPLSPSQQAAKNRADGLKKTLNEAIPGLNMK
jgi:hypothetical protein